MWKMAQQCTYSLANRKKQSYRSTLCVLTARYWLMPAGGDRHPVGGLQSHGSLTQRLSRPLLHNLPLEV